MTENLLLERAIENLERTYVAVGELGEGAWTERWPGGIACFSRMTHPVSNFAVVRQIDATQAASLRARIGARRAFNAYVLPGVDQEASCEALFRQGFGPAATLAMMVGGTPGPPSEMPLFEAVRFEDRLDVSRFIAQQFFFRQSSHLREAIALSTARSPFDLYASPSRPFQVAAMINRFEGTAGLYNLCVAHSLRDRGVGGAFLGELVRRVEAEDLLMTLQCDPGLELWYSHRGFQGVGIISVLTLDRKASQAIM